MPHSLRLHAPPPSATLLGLLLLLLLATPFAAAAQGAPPFAPGERLVYRVSAQRTGEIGRGVMWVDTVPRSQGPGLWALRFSIRTRVALVGVVNETESWVTPSPLVSHRFRRHERHPLSRHDEEVLLTPGSARWTTVAGLSGVAPTTAPLDELSFLYHLRTLPLDPGATLTLERHYDPARNPTRVRVVGREAVATPAGTFATVVVEMHVRDPRHDRGEATMRLNLTDAHRRLPVRMESTAPLVGRTVLLLESHTAATPNFAASGNP